MSLRNKQAVYKFIDTINLFANTALNINHKLKTEDFIIQLYDPLSGDKVDYDLNIIDLDNITLTTTTNESNLKLIIIG